MIKELKEEIRFAKENPLLSLIIIGTFTGMLPSLACCFIEKIF